MSKPSDILNRMKSKKNGAQSFIETMNEQVTENQFESKQEYNPIKENKTNHENEQETQTKHEHKIEQETETKLEYYTDQDTETKYEHKTEQETETKHEHIAELESKSSHEKITETIVEYKTILEKYSVKKTKEELFTRQTYLIRNDLIERFDKAAQTRRKGFKTEVMNELLEHFLNENGL